jgi:hypothetical protein
LLRQKLTVPTVPVAGSATLVGYFLSDGFIRGMTSTRMEFDVALSFLFVNSFKLSRKRFQYGTRFFSCLERFKVKFIDHVKLKIIFVLGFS